MTAAAVTTMAASSLTALLVLILGVGYAFMGQILIDYFNEAGSIIAWFFGIVVTSLVLCTIAIWASVSLLRRRLWAWRTLLVLTPVTALMGVVTASLLLPLVVAAAATTVFVLLLLPSTRGWIAPTR